MGLNDRRRKYNIQRSTYTTRKIHKKIDNDLVIYEHDRLITYGESITSGSPTFPMLYTDTRYGKQAHNVGEWEVIKVDGKTKTCITGEYLKNQNISNSENVVKLRVKHKSLLNFAYFGSCANLVETSLENIITLFGGKTTEEIEILKKDANLSEFEEYMLNTDSDPIYTMVLENVYESSIGTSVEEEKFEFPKTTDKNTGKTYLETEGPFFERYYNRLMDIAEFLDTRQSNVMWRVMTHDAIKNMDFTFIKNEDDVDDYSEGTTKMNSIINAIGRQMDMLKMYIDNIKYTNNLSYDNFSSMPDYILSDKLEMAGWEVYSVAPNPNDSKSNEINVKFMENLLINSKNILTRKGTRHGIDMLLSLFGLTSYDSNKEKYDYKIDEYVYVANAFNDADNLIVESIDNNTSLNVEKFNYWKTTFENTDGEVDTLQGLPLSIVVNEEKKYIIPWFDRLSKMDGDPYFEMNGGWFHLPRKKVINRVISVEGKDVVLENDNEKLPIYDESINRINIINDLSLLSTSGSYNQWMKVKNTVCYVTDISDFNLKYDISLKDDNDNYLEGWDDDKKLGFGDNLKTPSHYFILKNKNNSDVIGNFVTSYGKDDNGVQIISTTDCGWVNIPEDEFNDDTLSDDAKWVLYVESIEDNHKGNKPHRGDKYDDGSSYRDLFERVFGYSIDTDEDYDRSFIDVAYNCDDDSLKEDISLCGFNLETQVDNVKIHYFTDMKYNGNYYTETNNTFYESALSPHNFENNTNTWGEASDYSVINSKQMSITFNKEFIVNDDAYNYLIKSILPYLEQVIPSTTIVKIASSN